MPHEHESRSRLDWHLSEDRLPQEGRYVLGHYCGGNWIYRDDPDGVNYVVVRLFRGRVPGPGDTIRGQDQHGNNLRPYRWEPFGAGSFFGQDIDRWAYFR